jgi:mycoredoxin
VLGGILAATLLVCAGTLAYRAVAHVAHAAIAQEPPARAAATVPTPEPVEPGVGVAATNAAAEPATTPQQGESIPFTEPLPPPAALVVSALPSGKPAPPAPPNVASPAAASRRPTEAEVRSALAATPIVMYGTSWCSACRKTRQFLAENGLHYQEIDADLTPGGWAKVQQLSGGRAVPVVLVDGEVMVGLSPQRIMNAVARSMERRLGVTGIVFKAN